MDPHIPGAAGYQRSNAFLSYT